MTNQLGNFDAHRRAGDDFTAFFGYGQTAAQLSIAANGGALIALMAFLSGLIDKGELPPSARLLIVVGSVFYLFGVAICTLSMLAFSWSKLHWGYIWEKAAFDLFINYDSADAKKAEAFQRVGGMALTLSILAFVPGSIATLLALLQTLDAASA